MKAQADVLAEGVDMCRTILTQIALAIGFTLLGTGTLCAHEPLPKAEVKRLLTSAKSASDFQKLADHYKVIADHHTEDALEHEALAARYAANPTGREQKNPMSAQTAAHCKTYAEHCRKLAAEARAMANDYAEMAKGAK